MGIMEKKMETTIMGYIRLRVCFQQPWQTQPKCGI